MTSTHDIDLIVNRIEENRVKLHRDLGSMRKSARTPGNWFRWSLQGFRTFGRVRASYRLARISFRLVRSRFLLGAAGAGFGLWKLSVWARRRNPQFTRRERETLSSATSNPQSLQTMKSSTKDKIKGQAQDAKGHLKETAGKVTNSDDMKIEGKRDQAEGHARKAVGEAKELVNK